MCDEEYPGVTLRSRWRWGRGVHQLPAGHAWRPAKPGALPGSRGHADVRHPQLAGVRSAVAVAQTVLQRGQGAGQGRAHARIERLARRGVETAGNIDAEDRSPPAVHRSNCARLRFARRTLQARTEDGIDHHTRPRDAGSQRRRVGAHVHVDAAPTRRGDVVEHQPTKARLVGDHHGAYPVPPGGQVPRGDQAVPPVIAMPGDNEEVTDASMGVRPDTPRHLPSGDLHELQRRDATFECRCVELGNLLRGEVAEFLGTVQESRHLSSTSTSSPRLGPPMSATARPRPAISRCPALPMSAAGPWSMSAYVVTMPATPPPGQVIERMDAAPISAARIVVIALPKWSTTATCPRRPFPRRSANAPARTTGSSIGSPDASILTPEASSAAAGAKTSRPWNVGDAFTGTSRDTARRVVAPASSQRYETSPLSGATQRILPTSMAIARRSVPTSGSTTAQNTAPSANASASALRWYAPASTSPGGTPWVPSRHSACGSTRHAAPVSAAA